MINKVLHFAVIVSDDVVNDFKLLLLFDTVFPLHISDIYVMYSCYFTSSYACYSRKIRFFAILQFRLNWNIYLGIERPLDAKCVLEATGCLRKHHQSWGIYVPRAGYVRGVIHFFKIFQVSRQMTIACLNIVHHDKTMVNTRSWRNAILMFVWRVSFTRVLKPCLLCVQTFWTHVSTTTKLRLTVVIPSLVNVHVAPTPCVRTTWVWAPRTCQKLP